MAERSTGAHAVRSVASAAALALTALLGLDAEPARAFVPKPDRALAAIAQANLTSGRTQAIQLDLVMRIGDQAGLATGQLVSHPSGLARLELRGSGGRVDRYLLSGPELLAAKDGEALADPQPMLQPVFLLQPSSQETLRVALESFGVDSRFIGVAPCGELDCYVFGDPALAAPVVHRLPVGDRDGASGAGNMAEAGSTDAGVRAGAAGDEDGLGVADEFARDAAGRRGTLELEPTREPGRPIARLWADTETLQIQRIDRDSGESLQLGPLVRFERLMVPGWLEIERPGEPVIHFDVKRAVRVNATPQAFNPSWLYSPIDPADPAAGGSAPALASPAASPVPAP